MMLVVKNPPANARDLRHVSSIPGLVGKILWRRTWQLTFYFKSFSSSPQVLSCLDRSPRIRDGFPSFLDLYYSRHTVFVKIAPLFVNSVISRIAL